MSVTTAKKPAKPLTLGQLAGLAKRLTRKRDRQKADLGETKLKLAEVKDQLAAARKGQNPAAGGNGQKER